jgi:hypothetical protein
MENSNKQNMKQDSVKTANESVEKTKNQNHNSKKEGLGPNTKR